MRRFVSLLLDFVKAYDTVLRPLIAASLRWHGFESTFVGIIDSLHMATLSVAKRRQFGPLCFTSCPTSQRFAGQLHGAR